MDLQFCLIFQLLSIFIASLQTEGVTNDEVFLISPKPRRYQRDYSCTIGTEKKNTKCCTCPGSCGQTYPRKVTRTYSKGIKVLRLYFSIRDQNKTNNNVDIKMYICPRNSTSDVILQDCLLSNPLRILNKSKNYNSFKLDVEVPPNLTCRHCLIQWAITKDMRPNSIFSRRQYFGCSDIAIMSANDPEFRSRDMLELGSGTDDSQTSTVITSIASTQPAFQTSYGMTTPHSTTASLCWAVGDYAKIPGVKEWCYINCMRGYCPETHCKCVSKSTTSLGSSASGLTTNTPLAKTSPEIITTGSSTNSHCWAVGVYANVHGMDEWCNNNCKRGYCPKTHCQCTSKSTTTVSATLKLVCQGSGVYASVNGMDQWCQNNCLRGYCPASHCKCISEVRRVTKLPLSLNSKTTTERKSVCRAIGVMATVPGMHRWCTMNCMRGYCPASHCKCSSSEDTTRPYQKSHTIIVNPTAIPITSSVKPLINTTRLLTSRSRLSDTSTKSTYNDTANTFNFKTKQIRLSSPKSTNGMPSLSTTSGKLPTTLSQRKNIISTKVVTPPPLLLPRSKTGSNTTLSPTTSATTVTSTTTLASPVTRTTVPAFTVTGTTAQSSKVTGVINQTSTMADRTVKASTVTSTTTHATTIMRKTCKATEPFADIADMDNWCDTNCNNGHCPEFQCKCDSLLTTTVSTCRARQPYARAPGMNKWCETNCAMGYCPASHCQC